MNLSPVRAATVTTTPRRKGRPKLSEAGLLEERIMLAARRCFIEHGFTGTTMERVAHDAGTTRQSVASRFADRGALLTAVAKQKSDAVTAKTLRVEPSRRSSLDRLGAVARNLLLGVTEEEQVALSRVQWGETGRLPDLAATLIQANLAIEQELQTIVLAAQAEGSFANCSAAAVATCIVSVMVSHPIKRAMVGDPLFRNPERLALYFDQMWSYILSTA